MLNVACSHNLQNFILNFTSPNNCLIFIQHSTVQIHITQGDVTEAQSSFFLLMQQLYKGQFEVEENQGWMCIYIPTIWCAWLQPGCSDFSNWKIAIPRMAQLHIENPMCDISPEGILSRKSKNHSIIKLFMQWLAFTHCVRPVPLFALGRGFILSQNTGPNYLEYLPNSGNPEFWINSS